MGMPSNKKLIYRSQFLRKCRSVVKLLVTSQLRPSMKHEWAVWLRHFHTFKVTFEVTFMGGSIIRLSGLTNSQPRDLISTFNLELSSNDLSLKKLKITWQVIALNIMLPITEVGKNPWQSNIRDGQNGLNPWRYCPWHIRDGSVTNLQRAICMNKSQDGDQYSF